MTTLAERRLRAQHGAHKVWAHAETVWPEHFLDV